MKQIIAVLAIFLALAVLNPDMRDFRDYVESKLADKLSEESGSDSIGRFGAGAIAMLAEQVSERKNYFLFSIYTIDLNVSDGQQHNWQFLGAAGMFFQLRGPEHQSSSRSTLST